jgi:cobalt/nickel transport system ATP-binding protein
MSRILELTDVHYSYPNARQEALGGVNFHVDEGEKIALVGANGAGKSTLLMLLNGMIHPTVGAVSFHGSPISYEKKSLRELRRRIGFVYQNPDMQIIAPTVYQDVAFGPVNLGLEPDEVRRAVTDALRQVGLSGFERRVPHQLSGGEKKRVSIAGVLAMDPDILVLDEPTSMLDPAGSEDIMELLNELNGDGRTIIISTHDVELAYPWADRVVLMQGGQVRVESTPDEAFSDSVLVREARLSLPIVLEIYQSLIERGMVPGNGFPRSPSDLIHCLESQWDGAASVPECGCIYLWNVDSGSESSMKVRMEQEPTLFVGAMGSRAKEFAGQNDIPLDYTYGVIDKCLLRATGGENALILTSEGMVGRVESRVETFSHESGRQVTLVLL